jgi:hypothetical protein
MIARPCLIGAGEKRALRCFEQPARFRLHRSDGNRGGRVRDPAVLGDADVEGDDVATLQLIGAGDPVDDHRVGRGADRAREAPVALERRLRALRGDEPVRGGVEVGSADAGVALRAQHLQAASLDRAGGRHAVDLLGSLPDDH